MTLWVLKATKAIHAACGIQPDTPHIASEVACEVVKYCSDEVASVRLACAGHGPKLERHIIA